MNPQEYPVDLSQDAWDHKMNLIKKTRAYVDEINKNN
jgi:nicotinate phosphoribosyltransferase